MSIATARVRWRRPTWQYLYSEEGQEVAAKHFFRSKLAAAAKAGPHFPEIKLYTIKTVFGGWTEAQKKHFADGGVFDQIYRP
jgi:sulfate transport system substrate-binding protein